MCVRCVGTTWRSISANVLISGLVLFVFLLSKLFMEGHKNDLESQAAMLVLPIVASLLNVLVPFFYSWLGQLEKFQNPRNRTYVTIARYLLLPPLSAFCLKLADSSFFFSKLCLDGLVGSSEVWNTWIHLLQRLLHALPSLFCLLSVSLLECYISPWGQGILPS